jgi:hypothetical protein
LTLDYAIAGFEENPTDETRAELSFYTRWLPWRPRGQEGHQRLALAVGGKLKNEVDVQHGLENAPATLRRLFEGRNEGKQLLRVAE